MGSRDGPSEVVLTPDDIAAWLGLREDESLVSGPAGRSSAPRRQGSTVVGLLAIVAGLCALLATPLVAGSAGGSAALVTGLLGAVGVVAGGVVLRAARVRAQRQPWLTQGDPVVEADGAGLSVTYPSVGRAEWFAWTALTAIERSGGVAQHCVVTTATGRRFHFRADAPNADTIVRVVSRVLEFRRRGGRT